MGQTYYYNFQQTRYPLKQQSWINQQKNNIATVDKIENKNNKLNQEQTEQATHHLLNQT